MPYDATASFVGFKKDQTGVFACFIKNNPAYLTLCFNKINCINKQFDLQGFNPVFYILLMKGPFSAFKTHLK